MSQSKIDKGIVLDKVGKILKGLDSGQYIRIKYDPERTGGYFIFQSTVQSFDSPETYDSWVEDEESLNSFFKDSNWIIDWKF